MSKTPTQDQLITPNSKISVSIPWATAKKAYEKALQHEAQHMKADGFRAGKVPLHMVEKMVDQQHLFEHALQEVFPDAYREALTASKKMPLTQPEIEPVQLEKEKDWLFNAYFAEKPELTLGDYKKVVKAALKEVEKEIAAAPKDKPLTDPEKDNARVSHIFKGLVASVKPKIQELLVRAEVNRSLQQLADQLQQLNLTADNYLKSRGMTVEQLREQEAAQALASLQIEFILADIAREEKLAVTDAEIDEAIEKMAKDLTPEQKQNREYRTYLFSALLKQKVLSFLLSIK